jgi:hypothetical protein
MDIATIKVTPCDQQGLDLLVQGCNKEIAGQLKTWRSQTGEAGYRGIKKAELRYVASCGLTPKEPTGGHPGLGGPYQSPNRQACGNDRADH